MYFPDRGCVPTLLTLYVYATGWVNLSICSEAVETVENKWRVAADWT